MPCPVAALCGVIVAASPNPQAPDSARRRHATPIADRDRLTGDWWGLRSDLEAIGLTIGGEYVAELSAVVDGGVREDNAFRNLFTLDATLDLETAFDLDGATLFVQYLSVNPERGGSADSGDIQTYSNIENDRNLDVIYELWYEQRLFDDRLRLKLGKVDANSEFAFVNAAGDFANSSAGFSPTIFPFPSYPDPATSVNAFLTPIDNDQLALTLAYGLYDGALQDGVPTGRQGPASFFSPDRSSDLFHIAQADLAWNALRPEGRFLKDGRVSAGAWYHSGRFENFDADTQRGTAGFFATAEIRAFDPDAADDDAPTFESATDTPDRGVYVFAQYGWANDDISEFAHHLGAGVVWRGPATARPHDSLGLYATYADLSDHPSAGFDDDELALDAYYKIQLTPAVFVQPELQYIINPSGDPTIDNALVAGLRVGVTF